MPSQSLHHTTSGKHDDLRLLSPLSSSPNNLIPSTPLVQATDPSGPLTPDVLHLGNPFAAFSTSSSSTSSSSSSSSSVSSSTPVTPSTTAAAANSTVTVSSTPAFPLPSLSPVRLVGDYELSETKVDDFKCARHLPTGEALLYKEYSLDVIRQRLEPYQRLTALLQSMNKNSQFSIEQLALKYHFHFFRDILPLERTAIVLYTNYTTNLHQYITDKQGLNENETRKLFSQIVRAVQLCHQVGLIVRDLKLRKIIFHDQSRTHLLITGLDEAIMLATPITNDDMVSSRFSCPVYACPEIVLNRQRYSGKMADSWSLGIILYTMLFGRYPFCDRTLVGLFIKIGRCRPDFPRTISLKARSLLRSLIRVKPDERLLTQDILGHIWFTGEQSLSTLSMTTTSIMSNTIIHDDALPIPSHPSQPIHTNCTNSSDYSSTEDAVVPSIECE